MLSAISDAVYSYTNQMPLNTVPTVLKSGVYSFVLSTIFSGSLEMGAVVGAVASTLSLVHALTVPLFKKMVGGNLANWYQRAAHMVINLALTQTLVNAVNSSYRVNLIAGAVSIVGLSLLLSGFENSDLNLNALYILV